METEIATGNSSSIAALKPYLLHCGYRENLVFPRYAYSDDRAVDLAAFIHEPLDARSACIAAIECGTNDPRNEVLGRRGFGAPIVFTHFAGSYQVWRPGPRDVELVDRNLAASELPGFFERHERLFSPSRVYTAKTIGRLARGAKAVDRYVDTTLLPFAEQQVGNSLVLVVENVVETLKRGFGRRRITDSHQEWILKTTFRLLAAKVLQDKEVRSFQQISFNNLEDLFAKVKDHYGADDDGILPDGSYQQEFLKEAASTISQLWDLRHLTTESLADVYERALIDKDTRKISGTHRTPSYVADYMLWQLSPWLAQVDPADMRVFEAACGHAPFLVAAMRLLRTMELNLRPDQLRQYFRERLAGRDYDPFAIEVARLSLTLADVPNRNGWNEVKPGNILKGNTLADEVKQASVVLSNPPFEGAKPLKMLQVILDNLQPGGIFGLIIPSGQLLTRDPRKKAVQGLRDQLLKTCQLAEVMMLPDGIFEHADQECTLLLGRRTRGTRVPLGHVRFRRIREEELPAFRDRYEISSDRVYPQTRLASRPDKLLWVEELDDEVWSKFTNLPRLAAIADVGKGFDRVSTTKVPEDAIEQLIRPGRGAVAYYKNVSTGLRIDETPPVNYTHADFRTVQTPRWGKKTSPQVLINYAPVDRGAWRLKPFIDREGRPFTSRFMCVRPKSDKYPLEYLWALCCSPIANGYIFTHVLKRDILVGTVREIPVPRAGVAGIRRVVAAVTAYFDGCRRLSEGTLFTQRDGDDITVGDVHQLLRKVDAEVLRLYDLPARSEHTLLRLFHEGRPGVPGEFKGYFPSGFSQEIPLYVYLSDSYQHYRKSGRAVLTSDAEETFGRLIKKNKDVGLTPDERVEFRRLQAETAGRDYAITDRKTTWLDSIETRERESEAELAAIANRLADLDLRRRRRR